MTKDEIIRLADKYQKKADKAYRNYMSTGIQRYYREYSNNDELARALRIAANAADNHNAACTYRNYIASWAKEMQVALHTGKSLGNVANEIVSYAELTGLIMKY